MSHRLSNLVWGPCRHRPPGYDGARDDWETQQGSGGSGSSMALLCLPALAGCYVPVRFDVEIEISRSGYYDMIFDGYVARAALYQEVRDRKIDSLEEREKANAVIADFKRDSATHEANYVRQRASSRSTGASPATCCVPAWSPSSSGATRTCSASSTSRKPGESPWPAPPSARPTPSGSSMPGSTSPASCG